MPRRQLARTLTAAALAALASSSALADTRMELQVSRAGLEDWSSAVVALPGDSLDVRVRVSYSSDDFAPLGLSSVVFQPIVSHWRAGQDVMGPLVNGGGGGQHTTPIGAVDDQPGQYGRIMPFATRAVPNPLVAHAQTVNGVSYLRIAQSHVTSWFGGTGNSLGGGGVNIHQWNVDDPGRMLYPEPVFNSRLTNVVLFKFKITLDPAGLSARTMAIDVPLAGINQQPNPYVGWYNNATEPVGSIRDVPQIFGATIQVVPAPGAIAPMLAAGLVFWRRRATR